MQAALFICLVLQAPSPREHAQEFLDLFRTNDLGAQQAFAAKAPLDIEYAVVVHLLLQGGHPEAAAALAKLRTGPEHEGLKRLLTVGVPTRDEEVAWIAAEQRVQDSAKCLTLLKGAGDPILGSLHGARILYTRARALMLDQRREEARADLARCADFARACGWLHRVRDAEALRWRVAPKGSSDALAAANGLVTVLEQLGHQQGEMTARARRAGLLLDRGKFTDGRKELMRAKSLAHKFKKRALEAQLWARLALSFHRGTREPRRALKFYNEALKELRKLPAGVQLHQVLQNSALVLTDLTRYDEALLRLDELLKLSIDGKLRRLALRQRAYVLRRQGRVVKSRAGYLAALTATEDVREKLAIRVELGVIETLNGDLRAAEAHFDHVLKSDKKNIEALAGRGAIRAMRGNEAGSEADFAAALKLTPTGQLLLKRAAARRQLGRISLARVDAANALKVLIKAFLDEDTSRRDYGNTAAAYTLAADLVLLEGKKREKAIDLLEAAAVFFYRLKDVPHAVPAYARWTLSLTDPDQTLQRFQVLNAMAQGTPRKAMKSIAKCVEGVLYWKSEQPKKAVEAWQAAHDLAVEAGSREQQAAALAQMALVKGPEPALRALALMDGERLNGPETRPFVAGESAEYAASIGLRDCKDAAVAFELIERARAARLLRALRGRAAVLDAMLSGPLYAKYVAARAFLMEHRAERSGVAEAEREFDEMVAWLRRKAPEAAAIAFPQVPKLQDVQKALRPDEVLVLMLDDPYANHWVAVTRTGATMKKYNRNNPFGKGFGKNIKRWIIAPDGRLSVDPGVDVYYIPTAARFLRLRQAAPPVGKGAARQGNGPQRLPARLGKAWLQLLHIGTPVRVDLRHPHATQATLRRGLGTDAVVLAGADLVRGTGETVDGLAAVAEAMFAHGARHVIIPLKGPPPPTFWERVCANCLDQGMAPDFALLHALRQQEAGVVVWGVPAR